MELALAIPLLMIVLLGIVDFGKALNYYNDTNHVAEVAARYAAVGALPSTTQDPKCGGFTALKDYIVCEAGQDSVELASGCSPAGNCTGAQGGPTICVSMPTQAVGGSVTVGVTSNYKWLPVPAFIGGSTGNFGTSALTGKATMRLETAPPGGYSPLLAGTSPCP